MNKLIYIFVNVKVRYNNLINCCWNNTVDYYHFGYREFKIYLIFYLLLKFNFKEYKNEIKEFYEIFSDSVDKFLNNNFIFFYPYRSKIVEKFIMWCNCIRYLILFSRNPFINFASFPYIIIKKHSEEKRIKKLIKTFEKTSYI